MPVRRRRPLEGEREALRGGVLPPVRQRRPLEGEARKRFGVGSSGVGYPLPPENDITGVRLPCEKVKPRADLASNAGARGGELAQRAAALSSHPAIAAAARAIEAHKGVPGALMPILHALQHELGCIPPEAVPPIAEALNLSRAEVHGVITFYPHFRQTPPGRHVVEICRAESCQAMGGEHISAHARKKLALRFPRDQPRRRLHAGTRVLPGPVRAIARHADRRRALCPPHAQALRYHPWE